MFTKKNILKLAYKYKICPFELALDISSYSDFIICDYNYAFNKISLLKRYFVIRLFKIFKIILWVFQ